MATTDKVSATTMMEFEKLLDLSFDSAFAGRASLRWWPWVGSRFSISPLRTMVVGESIYNWGEGFEARYEKSDALRQTHSRHALNYRRDSPYVRNFERAIYQAYAPSEEQKLALWSSVAYHNLVLDPLKISQSSSVLLAICEGMERTARADALDGGRPGDYLWTRIQED